MDTPLREATTTTRDVNARGARVRFVDAGKGPPLLLVHGYLSSHLVWEDVVPALAESFHVIVPDLPGFGDSEKPPPGKYAYTPDAFAESLVDLVAALGLSRVAVCGHSMGGSVALALAANHPAVADKLILVDPLVYPSGMDPLARTTTMPVLGPLFFKQLFGKPLFKAYFQRRMYGAGFDIPWARVDQLFDAFNAPAAREAAYATLIAMEDKRSLVAKVPRITAPTLVGWGRGDRSQPVSYGRRLAKEIRGSRFEVFECGHSPPEECPAAFVDVARSFLEDVAGKAS